MINKLGDDNNIVDLDAYGRGLSDMYDALKNLPSSQVIISTEQSGVTSDLPKSYSKDELIELGKDNLDIEGY